MNFVTAATIGEMLTEAEKSPRRRAHRNFHATLDEPIHRLLIGAMPDTVFPVHRHREKFELLIVLHGELEVVITDGDGNVLERKTLTPDGACSVVEYPPCTWHTCIVKKPTVMLEVKPGPYTPITPEDTLDVKL